MLEKLEWHNQLFSIENKKEEEKNAFQIRNSLELISSLSMREKYQSMLFFLKNESTKNNIVKEKSNEPYVKFMLTLNIFVDELRRECKEKAEIIEFIWNNTINTANTIIRELHQTGWRQENSYLNEAKETHETYYQFIQKEKENKCNLSEKINEQNLFIRALITNLRKRKKHSNKLENLLKECNNKLNELKDMYYDMQITCTNLIVDSLAVSKENARQLLTKNRELEEKKKNNYRFYTQKVRYLPKENENEEEVTILQKAIEEEFRKQSELSYDIYKTEEGVKEHLKLITNSFEEYEEAINCNPTIFYKGNILMKCQSTDTEGNWKNIKNRNDECNSKIWFELGFFTHSHTQTDPMQKNYKINFNAETQTEFLVCFSIRQVYSNMYHLKKNYKNKDLSLIKKKIVSNNISEQTENKKESLLESTNENFEDNINYTKSNFFKQEKNNFFEDKNSLIRKKIEMENKFEIKEKKIEINKMFCEKEIQTDLIELEQMNTAAEKKNIFLLENIIKENVFKETEQYKKIRFNEKNYLNAELNNIVNIYENKNVYPTINYAEENLISKSNLHSSRKFNYNQDNEFENIHWLRGATAINNKNEERMTMKSVKIKRRIVNESEPKRHTMRKHLEKENNGELKEQFFSFKKINKTTFTIKHPSLIYKEKLETVKYQLKRMTLKKHFSRALTESSKLRIIKTLKKIFFHAFEIVEQKKRIEHLSIPLFQFFKIDQFSKNNDCLRVVYFLSQMYYHRQENEFFTSFLHFLELDVPLEENFFGNELLIYIKLIKEFSFLNSEKFESMLFEKHNIETIVEKILCEEKITSSIIKQIIFKINIIFEEKKTDLLNSLTLTNVCLSLLEKEKKEIIESFSKIAELTKNEFGTHKFDARIFFFVINCQMLKKLELNKKINLLENYLIENDCSKFENVKRIGLKIDLPLFEKIYFNTLSKFKIKENFLLFKIDKEYSKMLEFFNNNSIIMSYEKELFDTLHVFEKEKHFGRDEIYKKALNLLCLRIYEYFTENLLRNVLGKDLNILFEATINTLI